MHRPATSVVILAGMLLGAGGSGVARAIQSGASGVGRDTELAREPSWTMPRPAEVRRRAAEWAERRAGETGGEVTARVDAIWDGLQARRTPGDTVDAAMETACLLEPRAAALQTALGSDAALDLGWLDAWSASDFGKQAVMLWVGRELVRHDRFDEALPLLADLDLATSVDPATLLFHRGCCQHWLLDRTAALDSFERLLERVEEIPVRYARMANLLRADIAEVESDSLDHIARRMRDVRRRLDLGRAGPETRRVQQGVLESLDKLIADLERQRQQQQGGGGGAGAGGGQGTGEAQPMDDSKIARGLGKGEVRKRDLGDGDGWGDLPPHEREAALQQIGREYPPYYREAIEQYFKRLATDGEENP